MFDEEEGDFVYVFVISVDGDGEVIGLDIVGNLFFFVVDDEVFVIFREFGFVG